jgi:hypothetical protein
MSRYVIRETTVYDLVDTEQDDNLVTSSRELETVEESLKQHEQMLADLAGER